MYITALHNTTALYTILAQHVQHDSIAQYTMYFIYGMPITLIYSIPTAYLELMRYCAIPTDSGVPVIVTNLSVPSPSLPAILIIAPELTLLWRRLTIVNNYLTKL